MFARCARITAFALAAVAAPGCYSYSVIEPSEATPGEGVRARLTTAESARLEELVGFRNRVIAGEIVEVEPSGIVLSIPMLVPEPGLNGTRLHQRVTLPASGIVELEQRRLSRWRTFGLVGAAAAVAGYALAATFADDTSEPGDDKPDPNNLVVPIRFRFP